MSNYSRAFLLIAGLAITVPALSTPITVSPTEDTYITQHGGLGGVTSSHGSDSVLYAINANGGNPMFRTYPLLQFDLSAYAGSSVNGPATFEIFVQGSFGGSFAETTRQVSIHEVLTPWDAVDVTFNTFGATPDVQFGTDVTAALDTVSLLYPGTGSPYLSWTLSAAVIQSWIDDPSMNHGILLFNQELPNFRDLVFGSMENQNAPRLSFAVTDTGTPLPEPTSIILLAFGLLLMSIRWNARSS